MISGVFRRSKNPFKRKEEKIVGSIKYTGAKLHEKGVILEIDGLQPNQYVFIIILTVPQIRPHFTDIYF